MKPQTQAKRINEKIQAIIDDRSRVIATYQLSDDSVQAELRLRARWSIDYAVDRIAYPKNLARNDNPMWDQMRKLEAEIWSDAEIVKGSDYMNELINARTKIGPARREEAKAIFEIEQGRAFLAAHRISIQKSVLAEIRKQISALQAQQKALLPELRKANSEFLAGRKAKKAELTRQNTEALKSGRFWEAAKDALKNYFHPPFERNYLTDVSEKWRAALYTEMASTAWKAGKGDWRHKNIGTGRGYLCGIDDNGDEWGHPVNLHHYIDFDEYGDMGYVATVEDAMSSLFGVSIRDLEQCQRQGDILFHPEPIPDIEMKAEDEWEIRESHTVTSPGLQRNGRYIQSKNKITVSHTSHAPVVLPAGNYRIYALQVADAD